MDDSEKTATEYADIAGDYSGKMTGLEPMKDDDSSELTKAFFDLDRANAPEMQIQLLPHFPARKELGRASEGSSGIDLYAAIKTPIRLNIIGHRVTIPTGIRVALPMGYESQVRPRSGLSHDHGVTVLNTPGTIDSDYRGEIGVILVLLGPGKFTVEPGDRIAQLVVAPVIYPRIEFVDELDDTSRGAGGFGHTGLK